MHCRVCSNIQFHHSTHGRGLTCEKGVKTVCSSDYNQEPCTEEAPLCLNCCQLRLRHRLEEHAVCQTPAAARKERTANPGRRWGVWSVQESVCFNVWSHELYIFLFEGGQLKWGGNRRGSHTNMTTTMRKHTILFLYFITQKILITYFSAAKLCSSIHDSYSRL